MSVKLQLLELHENDSYSNTPEHLQVGDVIEFDSMPKFGTWDLDEYNPAALRVINGFDYSEYDDDAMGTNLRTGKRKYWCFHAVKFERV